MKLTAFRIKNFRSIIDTKWHDLAFDNITCLIGQNESGKTSVLEGLKAFHDGQLIEDMLRSDLSMPEVTCRFSFDISEFEGSLDFNRLHPGIREKLSSLDMISLSRIWEPGLTSFVVTGEELNEIFRVEDDNRREKEVKIEKLLRKNDEEIKKCRLALEKAEKNYLSACRALEEQQEKAMEIKRSSRSLFSRNKKGVGKSESAQVQEEIRSLEAACKEKQAERDERSAHLKALHEKEMLQQQITKVREDIQEQKNRLAAARERLHQFPEIAGLFPSEKELRTAENMREQYRLEAGLAKDDLQERLVQYDIMLLTAEKVYGGDPYDTAYEQAETEVHNHEHFMGPEELGEALFRSVPDFEMFEDFSSLLPNRIDLEDIAAGNTAAEGYKAAVNFLTITGLDFSFFQQPSSRILKQKIENLNGELTLNFQEFWRQNVGKNNKIKINFELAHYDHSHGEKSGKPFIEFWIKDEAERLYPKQRSRGVRWFLSFFLELKATAMDKNRRNKILLIDEPGVSLHARAQEDVLKVFDDIREHMQIIYSTHSPHLIDVNKLYRVIAVQRAVEDDMKSETVVLNARSLKAATADTLSPVYAMMGARLNQQDIIKSFNNVVVKDLATFYFLKAILHLTGYKKKECYFLPASGTASMPMMINILIGWGLEYLALNFGNEEEKFMYNKLRKELFDNNVDLAGMQLLFLRDFPDVEDLFSTIDFKKYIVHVREGITVHNSEYLRENSQSRAVMASNFLQSVHRGEVRYKDLDDETRENLDMLTEKLTTLLK
jgi:AAA15 family ATPase/GTPase